MNKYNPHIPANVRETFGVVDKETGTYYSDLLAFRVETLDFDSSALGCPTITDNKEVYYLHMDLPLRRKLAYLKEGETAKVIISYQKRKDIAIALARIYRGQ